MIFLFVYKYTISFLEKTKLSSRFKSSHQRCSIKKGVLRNFIKFTGKYLCQSLFLNKVAGLRPATLLKKRLWHRCFPANFAKFLRTPILQNTSGRLLLKIKFLPYVFNQKQNKKRIGRENNFGSEQKLNYTLATYIFINSLHLRFEPGIV